MLSAYLALLGIGVTVIGVGLLVEGPLALDRRWTRQRSDSAYVTRDGSLDLHADRTLGELEGRKDELWRPVASVHFWSLGAAAFGAAGAGGMAAGWADDTALGVAVATGLGLGYAGARLLRALPPRPEG